MKKLNLPIEAETLRLSPLPPEHAGKAQGRIHVDIGRRDIGRAQRGQRARRVQIVVIAAQLGVGVIVVQLHIDRKAKPQRGFLGWIFRRVRSLPVILFLMLVAKPCAFWASGCFLI